MDEEKDKLFGDKKIKTTELIRRSMKYIIPEIWSFVAAITMIIINVIIDLVFPYLTGQLTDVISGTTFQMSTIIFFALGYLGIAVVNQVILYFESMILQKAGQRIVYKLRMEVFEHIESMSLNQFNIMPVGSLVTRVANYTNSMSDLFTSIFVNMGRNIMTIIVVYIAMIVINPYLALFMLAFIIVLFIVSYVFDKKVSVIFRKERRYQSDINTFLSENLSGMKITQIFNQEKRKTDEFDVKNKNLLKARYGVTIAFAIYRPLISTIYNLSVALLFFLSIDYIKDSGMLVTFYLYVSRFYNPVQNLADNLNGLKRALSGCERLFNLLDVPPDVLDAPDAIDIDHFEGKIEFKNVWFAYEKEDWILKDVSFKIEPKQTVAFVGATGAGKTTILSLIVRNFEIQKGQILIDGIDIQKIKINSLRKHIGQMLQDVFLFSGTIKDNITLHDDSFEMEDIRKTCEYVNANFFIDKLPKGLDEEVVERGENFSSGQRQLLSFARTILHKPQILILDEATANIDTETEVLIQDSLHKMKNIGTMLVVAHRLSTIQHSDNIVVLNHGEIVEQGTHQELLKNKGYYYKLYQLQFENH